MKSPKVLVFGGTRYFGKRLVERMLEERWDIMIATRGQSVDSFGKRVKRFPMDREDDAAMQRAANLGPWDIVYDQICYAPSDAAAACKVFKGKVGRYIHTSTQSVYRNDGLQQEADFDPSAEKMKIGRRSEFDYPTGKRLVEAVFAQSAAFPVTMMRIPIVLGPDDYTGRLEFHIDHVKQGKPIALKSLKSEASLISSQEAANFLFWLSTKSIDGPINACSHGTITSEDMFPIIERSTGKKVILVPRDIDGDRSPIIDNVSRVLDASQAESFGFRFSQTKEWLSDLIREKCAK